MSIEGMKYQRNKLVTEAQEILNASEAESRNLTAEEREKFDRIMADTDAIRGDIQRAESLAAAESELRSAEPRKVDAPDLESDVDAQAFNARPEYRSAFYSYLRKGHNGLRGEEVRALEEGVNAEGGFMVETSLERAIVEAVNTQNVMRQVCTVLPIDGNRNIPVESATGSATWTAEEAAYTEADMTFSQATLGAYKLAALLKVSDELMLGNVLGDAGFEQYLASYFGRIFATAEEAAFCSGDGSNKPTGIFDATGGVPAGQTIDVGTTDTIVAEDIVNLYHTLDPQYRFGASWLMHDDIAKTIRKIRDASGASATTGNFMWQPGMQAGQPDRLFGAPVLVSNGCPNDVTTNDARLAVFGDFSYYYIAERGGYNFQRMNELYAATGQVGIRAWRFLDGKITLGSAFACLDNGS